MHNPLEQLKVDLECVLVDHEFSAESVIVKEIIDLFVCYGFKLPEGTMVDTESYPPMTATEALSKNYKVHNGTYGYMGYGGFVVCGLIKDEIQKPLDRMTPSGRVIFPDLTEAQAREKLYDISVSGYYGYLRDGLFVRKGRIVDAQS